MIIFSSPQPQSQQEINELKGNLAPSSDKKLMHSILHSKEKVKQGKLIKEAINQGLNSFIPDTIFQNLVKNYSQAKRLYGKTLLSLVTGYKEEYLERNIKIPEFQKKLKQDIKNKISSLKQNNLLDNNYQINTHGLELASLSLYMEELKNLESKGLSEQETSKRKAHYGSKSNTIPYKKGHRYKNLALKKSIKKAARRQHKNLHIQDLETFQRKAKQQINIIYAFDCSGSMKGQKIDTSKKAGIALAYKAIDQKDKVGLITFSDKVINSLKPSEDFSQLLKTITQTRATKQTNIVNPIKKAIELFPSKNTTNHLILLTDALPTMGEKPEEDTLEAVSQAKANEITISLIGINLNPKGKELAEKIVQIGSGKLYTVKNLQEIDKIILQDYYSLEEQH